MNICLSVEECVSTGDVLGLHRRDQKQGRASSVESTRASTVVLFSFLPARHFLTASSALPLQGDPKEVFLSASKQIGLSQTEPLTQISSNSEKP